MNPLNNYPEARKFLYLIQWVVNGVIVVAGAFYVLQDQSPDQWYVLVAGLGPVLWTYLGLTAQQNVDTSPVAEQ